MSKERDDDEGNELWRYVTKDIKPLDSKPRHENRKPSTGKSAVKASRRPATAQHHPPQKKSNDVDRSTDEKLRRGQMAIDARIDLHGMGQDRAHETLNEFLLSEYHHGCRCILVITGKGKDGKGVLRTLVPEWLREGTLMNIVLRFYPAKPQHGGDGALYVLLRRQRD